MKTGLRLAVVFIVGSHMLGVLTAHAAVLTFAAKTEPVTVSLRAGESKKITLGFTNTGTATWIAGRSKIAVFLYGTESQFKHPSWIAMDLPAVITPSVVKPGRTARATFFVTAPARPGTYTERFLLSSGPTSWIKGSTKLVTFVVIDASVASPRTSPPIRFQSPPASAISVAPALANPVDADSGWIAELVDRGGIEWQTEPVGHLIVRLAYKNVGSEIWKNTGASSVILTPVGGTSPFKDSSWRSPTHAGTLEESAVKPGKIGHVTLELRGAARPGVYQETFTLARARGAAISGGRVTFPIRVTTPRDYIAKGIVNGVDENLVVGGYKGALLLRSTKELALRGMSRQMLTFGFQNTGTASWGTLSLKAVGVQSTVSGYVASVRDSSWVSSTEPGRATVNASPGEIGFIGFTIKVPPKKGPYTASFRLYADNQPVEDGTVDIPITVTEDGTIEPESTSPISSVSGTVPLLPSISKLSPIPLTGDVSSLPDEPSIRVGLFATTDNQMIVRGVNGGFDLKESGVSVCHFEAVETVTVTYDRGAGVSRASGPRCASQTTGVYVASASDGISPLELTDYSRPVSWLPGANDNKFSGKLELRYAKSTDSVWIINELPIEWYLKGIGETSNSSPQEYQRALLTAARTYAMYHVQRATKHADENYTVDAKYDQVYRGYGAESRNPNVVAAVEVTRGQIVTYNGKLALTPYYSRSDGRTRSWTEVWGGGPYAWLVSVPVPWDNGRTLWGHGVGLSATGALGMANDGKTYDQILTYFYTGTELRRAYK